jgi:hypothetical protein
MLLLALLLIELTMLFFLSRWLTEAVFALCLLLFRARSIAVTILSVLNFPGTVVHELSHLFTAEILGVHTGKLTLVPDAIQEDEIKAGSVMIAATDPFRRYLIGLAPICIGLVASTTLAYFLFQNYYPITLLTVLLAYLLLAVSNAMFSSAEDLKGFIPFIITLGIMVGAAYFAGLRIGLTGPAQNIATQILNALTKSLAGVIGLNIMSLLLAKLLTLLTQKITRRKLYRK